MTAIIQAVTRQLPKVLLLMSLFRAFCRQRGLLCCIHSRSKAAVARAESVGTHLDDDVATCFGWAENGIMSFRLIEPISKRTLSIHRATHRPSAKTASFVQFARLPTLKCSDGDVPTGALIPLRLRLIAHPLRHRLASSFPAWLGDVEPLSPSSGLAATFSPLGRGRRI